ncbi:MAG TPA: HAD family phosphatase [Bacteroidota bacterium]|nr:HAD family phosphatase [Bacteroidota bacterium]
MISACIFDYGNVISRVDTPAFIAAVRPYAVGSITGEERIGRTKQLMIAYESGKMTTEEFIPAFLERAGIRMPQEEFVRHWSSFFTPIPFTRDLIRQLKPLYRLGLLSNTNPLHFEHVILPTDVYPLFDAVTLSYEVGALKPDRSLYLDMLRKLHVEAEQCLYFDDLKDNVDAAASLGMKTVHFLSPSQVAEQLRAWIPHLQFPEFT